MQERIEIGVGEELAEHLEAALPAPHSGQPVVDQGHPHSSSIAVPCFPAPRDAALGNGLSESSQRRTASTSGGAGGSGGVGRRDGEGGPQGGFRESNSVDDEAQDLQVVAALRTRGGLLPSGSSASYLLARCADPDYFSAARQAHERQSQLQEEL